MTMYGRFATVYDKFMLEAPHQPWLSWLKDEGYLQDAASIADVACGTGVLTVQLAQSARTRAVYGVDLSEEMLAEASIRAQEAKAPVAWFAQDMRDLNLPHAVDLICCICDSVNYLLTKGDVERFFQSVKRNLRPGGRFCFDVLGPARVNVLDDGLWYDVQPDAAILFSTQVDATLHIEYDVTGFERATDGRYVRWDEHHEQQYYDAQMLQVWLEKAGLTVDQLLGDFGASSVAEADRIVICAKGA